MVQAMGSANRGPTDAFLLRLSSGDETSDTDNDQLPDAWETQFNLDPRLSDASGDPDGDGISNLEEFQQGTHPLGTAHAVPRRRARRSRPFDTRLALFNPNAAPGGRPGALPVPARVRRAGHPWAGHHRAASRDAGAVCARHARRVDRPRPGRRGVRHDPRIGPAGRGRSDHELGRHCVRQSCRDGHGRPGLGLVSRRRCDHQRLPALLPAAEPESDRSDGHHRVPAGTRTRTGDPHLHLGASIARDARRLDAASLAARRRGLGPDRHRRRKRRSSWNARCT